MTDKIVYYRAAKLAPYLTREQAEGSPAAKESRDPAAKDTKRISNNLAVSSSHLVSNLSGISLNLAAASYTTTSKTSNIKSDEADAAAGGGRVSSFGNLLSLTPGRNAQKTTSVSIQEPDRSNRANRARQRTTTLPSMMPPPVARPNITPEPNVVVPDWRLRDRMKTVGVGLIVALNVGTDPPDIVKPHPCAVLQCWMDPGTVSRAKAKELIGERLEQQYARWQLNRKGGLKYRRALDPTVEDVRNLCLRLRSQARTERILLHYNGHGVPRPTDHGEIWVFDKNHTEYIPLSVSDLKQWMGKPAIVVLDCSAAGTLIPFFRTAPTASAGDDSSGASTGSLNPPSAAVPPTPTVAAPMTMDEQAAQWVRDTIVLCPCSENEWLPMHPDYPADIFTSCLTTPIPMALRWFVNRNPNSMSGLNPEAVSAIPGKANDRKTPLGELNWIFTAVTDSIAWNILPKPLFQRLFRQDLLVASMFRNFLLADRILRSLGCTPASSPPLPPGTADHPLWQAWDLACETLLFQLMQDGILGNHVLVPTKDKKSSRQSGEGSPSSSNGTEGDAASADVTESTSTQQPKVQQQQQPESSVVVSSTVSSPFFSEQLLAFEAWLEFAEIHKMKLKTGGPAALESPEQLPVVLQVLLSQVHRIRALMLLRRFLDLGPWAVNLSLSLGIFPYVMKLLQSPEYKSLLVSIWASILSFDPSCRVDVLKDGAFHHFVQHLMWGLSNTTVDVSEAALERTLAAFVLAVACYEYPAGQAECVRLNLHGNCCALLSSYEQGEHAQDDAVELHLPAHFRFWLCLCLANMVKDNSPMQTEAFAAGVHQRLAARMNDKIVDVRASVCYALGSLIGSQPKSNRVSSIHDLTSPQPQQLLHQQHRQGFSTSPGMMPQGVAAAANMVVQGTVPTIGSLSTQLQPTFAPTVTGIRNLQLNPMPAMAGQPVLPQGQPLAIQPRGQFWNHQSQLPNPQPGQSLPAQYLVQHGQPMTAHPTMGSPAGFLVGGGSIVSPHAQPNLIIPQLHPQQFPVSDARLMKPSVFEDRQRLDLDLSSIDAILQAIGDGSVVVRYEATVALGGAVAKYFDAFVFVAEDFSSAGSVLDEDEQTGNVNIPQGLENKDVAKFKSVWKALRSLQREDPFPQIAKAANDIVSVVHESLLRTKMKINQQEREAEATGAALEQPTTSVLGGIDEDVSASLAGYDSISTPTAAARGAVSNVRSEKSKTSKVADLRRVSSEVVSGKTGSMEENALSNLLTGHDSSAKIPEATNYKFPKSEFYEWKKSAFDPNFEWLKEEDDPDPLSPTGAARAYHDRRNNVARENGAKLAQRYASLAPKPPQPNKKKIELLLEEEDETILLAAEEEAAAKKKELQLKEKKLLENEGVKMTSLLNFHPYENYLMACGATDAVSLWDTESGERRTIFNNGNPRGSRMTSSFWINEDSSSLFLVGCDDGTVRIWGDIIRSNGESCSRPPSLISAFHAAPMEAGHWGSGLVCEWQPFSGTLIAGGNSKYIRCWDLEAEKVVNKLDTNSEAYVTTLTTAWDYDSLGAGQVPRGYHGIGKDIVVAGYSDGSLKLFDIRSNNVANDIRSHQSQTSGSRIRQRVSSYSEHKSWVVTTAFTSYSRRYELISGTVSGDIKTWDLRMSSSVRTIEIQRSTMTALAVHAKIPVVAAGSHAQFIKIATLDGDSMQVLRYHEKMANHRIGPVSCLVFHPYKPLLAAGATDSYIGLYMTKRSLDTNSTKV